MKRKDRLLKKETAPKARPEEKPRKTRDEQYILRKNAGMKAFRILLWGMLTFIFIRGALSVFKPDSEERVAAMIREFRDEYGRVSNQNAELMAFAQNFAREYLTYETKGEEDYRRRVGGYVSSAFWNSGAPNDFANSAEAVYVQAYRIEDYSIDQKDVYVFAEVKYVSRRLKEDGQTYAEEVTKEQMTLSVPVYLADGGFIVENIPMMLADSVSLEGVKVSEHSGTRLEDSRADAVKTSVENFLKAYYEQDESVIHYYLSTEADKDRFVGLDGRFAFLQMEVFRCYQEESGDILCLAEYRIQDADNQAKLLQRINLSVQESGGRYYIRSMGTRTGNLQTDSF